VGVGQHGNATELAQRDVIGQQRVGDDDFKAPGMVVSYTTDPEIQSGCEFLAQGLQTSCGRAVAVR
jgi:hypothetical protein